MTLTERNPLTWLLMPVWISILLIVALIALMVIAAALFSGTHEFAHR